MSSKNEPKTTSLAKKFNFSRTNQYILFTTISGILIILATMAEYWYLPKTSVDSYNNNISLHNESIKNYNQIMDVVGQNISTGNYTDSDLQSLQSAKSELTSLTQKTNENINKVDLQGDDEAQNFGKKTKEVLQNYKNDYTKLASIFDFQACSDNVQKDLDTINAKLSSFNIDKANTQEQSILANQYTELKNSFESSKNDYQKFNQTCLTYLSFSDNKEIKDSIDGLIGLYSKYTDSISTILESLKNGQNPDLSKFKVQLQSNDFSDKFNDFLTKQNQFKLSLIKTINDLNSDINSNNDEIIKQANDLKTKLKI
jgi:hypothetical protein